MVSHDIDPTAPDSFFIIFLHNDPACFLLHLILCISRILTLIHGLISMQRSCHRHFLSRKCARALDTLHYRKSIESLIGRRDDLRTSSLLHIRITVTHKDAVSLLIHHSWALERRDQLGHRVLVLGRTVLLIIDVYG